MKQMFKQTRLKLKVKSYEAEISNSDKSIIVLTLKYPIKHVTRSIRNQGSGHLVLKNVRTVRVLLQEFNTTFKFYDKKKVISCLGWQLDISTSEKVWLTEKPFNQYALEARRERSQRINESLRKMIQDRIDSTNQ